MCFSAAASEPYRGIVVVFLAGIAILAVEKGVLAERLRAEFKQQGLNERHMTAPVWTGFLASFYGDITEEILLRLFAFSLLA